MLTVKQETVFRFLLPALVLLVFLVRLIDGFLPGVLLAPTPDSVEPFVGALRMCQGEKYGFTLNGEFFPSRYSPALSFLLMPALYISSSPAAAGAAIGLWALVLMLFAVLLFHKDKEYGGTALACGGLFLVPCFLEYCGSSMTEIPYAALLFIMLWLFRSMLESEDDVPKLFFWYGITAGLCGFLRMTGYPMLLLPALFLFSLCRRKKKLFMRSWVFLLFPSAVTTLFSAVYNWAVFGSPSRSGYHFHVPLPYEFPKLLFSLSCIPNNINDTLKWGGRGLLIIGAALLFAAFYAWLCRKKDFSHLRLFGAECAFVMLQLGILVLLYFPHYYFSMRFFFPVVLLFVWLLVRSALGVARELKIAGNTFISWSAWLIGIEIMLVGCFWPQQDYCGREIAALCRFEKALPAQAVLIHNFDPGRTELFFIRNHSGRKQLPVTRKCEYADKIALRKRVSDLPSVTEYKGGHRADFLHDIPGKIDFFPEVLEEAPQRILKKLLVQKNPVYITGDGLNALTPEAYWTLRRHFLMKRVFQSPSGDVVFRVFLSPGKGEKES